MLQHWPNIAVHGGRWCLYVQRLTDHDVEDVSYAGTMICPRKGRGGISPVPSALQVELFVECCHVLEISLFYHSLQR